VFMDENELGNLICIHGQRQPFITLQPLSRFLLFSKTINLDLHQY